MKRICLLAMLALLPLAAQAETLICPVGGERFVVEDLPECTPDSRMTMMFIPASTCYEEQMLAQCPQNFLPIYKGFTTEDLALLEGFMNSETYDSAVDQSPYYLAYIIEKYIGENGSRRALELLLDGLVREPTRNFSDPVYLEDFLFEMQSVLRQSPDDVRPIMQALTSFVMLKAGQTEDAAALLEAASQHEIADLDNPVFLSYLAAIESCLLDHQSPYCDPRAVFPIN